MIKRKLVVIIIICLFLLSCSSTKTIKKQEVQEFNKNYKITNNTVKREYIIDKRENQTRDNNNSFSIVLIPDSQSYVDYRLQYDTKFNYPINQREIYYRQMDYVKENAYKNGGDFVFAVFLGDFVAHECRYKNEWIWASEATSKIIDALPYGFIPGNHDYDGVISFDFWKTIHIRGGRLFSKYFGPKTRFFKNKSWFGGASKNGLNQWSVIDCKGKKILFIGLEMEPSDKVLRWAQKIIDQHPGIPTIVATHSYLSCSVEEDNKKQSAYITNSYRPYADSNSPFQLWSKFISKNNQIFLVLSGHAFDNDAGEGLRVDINDFGQTVYSIMTDYQGRRHYLEWKKIKHNLDKIEECGDGWIRILDFNFDRNDIHITTYNPEFEMYETDCLSDYILPITWEWGNRFNGEN